MLSANVLVAYAPGSVSALWLDWPEAGEDFIDSCIARWVDGWVPRTPGFEKQFDNAGEVAFGMPLFNDAVMNGPTERRRVIARVNEIDGVSA